MLKIGIIGLGPDWDAVYRPALARLSRRLSVTAVCDPVASRSERAAEDLKATSVSGIRALLQRADVRAALVLDDAWHGLAPVRFALQIGKPLYLAGRLTSSLESLGALCRQASDQSVVICSELRLRTTPATTRIMELTATQLGSVEKAEVRLNVTTGENALPWLVAVIDACGVVIRSVPSAVKVIENEKREVTLCVSFGRVAANGEPVEVQITLVRNPTAEGVSATFHCRCGVILQFADVRLRWRTATGDEGEELLNRERPGAEVLLDHFARRIVGGLVPIPGLDDVCRILNLLGPHRGEIAAAFAP